MNRIIACLIVSMGLTGLAACGGPDVSEGHKVDASGKQDTALEALPDEVLAAALAAKPELSITEVEYETRDGNEYYDVGGTLPDGSEMELDMTLVDGAWTVVEFQRDIGMDLVPEDVAAVLAASVSGWVPARIIESDQGDGTVIYEFFGSGNEPVKHEISWRDGVAELLVDEWQH